MGVIMTFQTLGFLSATIFFLLAGSWFLFLERARRRDERLRQELQENVERVRGIVR